MYTVEKINLVIKSLCNDGCTVVTNTLINEYAEKLSIETLTGEDIHLYENTFAYHGLKFAKSNSKKGQKSRIEILQQIVQEYINEGIEYISYSNVSKRSAKYGKAVSFGTVKKYRFMFQEKGLIFESKSERSDRRIKKIIEIMIEDEVSEISFKLVDRYVKKFTGAEGMTRKTIMPRKHFFVEKGLYSIEAPDPVVVTKSNKEVPAQCADFGSEKRSKYIDNSEGNKVEYVKKFPRINNTGKYLILEKYRASFHEYYSEAIRKMLKSLGNMPGNRLLTNTRAKDIIERGAWEEIHKLIDGKQSRVLKYQLLEERLIIQANAHFMDMDGWEDYFRYIDGKNPFPMRSKRAGKAFFKDMTKAYDLIAEFIIVPMVAKGMMLAPLFGRKLFYSQSSSVNQYIEVQMARFKRYKEIKETLETFFPKGIQKIYVYKFILLSTTLHIKKFTDRDIKAVQAYYKENNIEISMTKTTTRNKLSNEDKFGQSLLKGLSKFFVKAGADVHSIHTSRILEKDFSDHLHRLTALQEDEKYQNLIELIEQSKKFLHHIYKVDELMLSTISTKVTQLAMFFISLSERFDGESVTREMMEEYFDFPDKQYTFQNKLKKLRNEGRGVEYLIGIQGITIDFLDSTEAFYGVFKRNTRIKSKKTGAQKKRQALDREAYDLVLDVVSNRPPNLNSKGKWGTVIVDWSSWWPHEVVPYLPLALYLHLYLPLRSAHILNLDRDNFLIKNVDGTIRSFSINTDKNTSRKEEHIVPNIYKNSLNVIDNLIELNKQMYPNLKKYKYGRDENAPWEPFYPLFPNEHGDSVLSKELYRHYFVKVVMKAQMELILSGSKKQIAWFRDNRKIPLIPEDIDRLTYADIENIELAFDLHSLRVTGATRLMQMGLPPQLIKYFTGHKNIDTLINIYIKIPTDELIESFFKIQNMVDTSSIEGMGKYHKSIPKVMFMDVNTKNPVEVLKVLEDNHLFTMDRNAYDHKGVVHNKEMVTDGLKRVSEIHWSFWIPYTYGMCGQPNACPFGAQVRCSLCPYLLTGPMYLHGIAAKTEQLQVRIFEQANIIADNRKVGINDNQTLQKQQEVDLEEFAGWHEILEKCQRTMNQSRGESSFGMSKELLAFHGNDIFPVEYQQVDQISGLMQVYERAKILNVNNRDVQNATYMLSSKIIKWCMLNDKIDEVKKIIDRPSKLIDWFLPQKNTTMIKDKTLYLSGEKT